MFVRIRADGPDSETKVVKVDSYEELLVTGCERLKLSNEHVKLTTLESGIQIEDDDGLIYADMEKSTVIFNRLHPHEPGCGKQDESKSDTFEVQLQAGSSKRNSRSQDQQSKLHAIFNEKLAQSEEFQKRIRDLKQINLSNLIDEELIYFKMDVAEFSDHKNNAIQSFRDKFNIEMKKMERTNDLETQCEIVADFKSVAKDLEKSFSDLQSELDSIEAKYACSPGKNLARKIRSEVDKSGELEAQNHLKIFKLPMKASHAFHDDKLKSFELGEVNTEIEHHYILLTGMTGVGKSLFVNNIVNYIYGVRFEDSFRFKLIIESEEIQDRPTGASDSKAESMTSWVTSYTFHYQKGFRIPFSLTIVDTPGFGDTRGVEYDEQIVKQIKKLFTNTDISPTQELTCIGFLIQASQARITSEQKYIFDQVLNIFARDMKNNIFIIFTFADEQDPPALTIVKDSEIPFAEGCIFKFNNIAVYSDQKDGTSQHFWKFGFESLEKFFKCLKTTQPVSLRLTNEVLKERSNLWGILKDLQTRIEAGITFLQSIEDESNSLEDLDKVVGEHKHRIMTMMKYISKVTQFECYNCQTCKKTCFSRDFFRYAFSQFLGSSSIASHCDVCGCSNEAHVSEKKIYEQVEENVTKKEIYRKYNIAVNDKNAKRHLLEKMIIEYRKGKKELMDSIQKANKCANRLDEIALRKSCLTNTDFVEKMISTEEQSSHRNKIQRLRHLRHMKEMSDILEKTRQNPDDVFKNMSDYEEKLLAKIESLVELN